ncbi:uncharacterized protein LOC131151742 isoform X2 [Malania oleifera]|uniref:uncharacterized protein LOC131151742 isoform X2 n=1 Tax=Malania oleifera TaxID=397392 RepID=UPI0025AECDAB|nr:uncharacterized protein LOC131151742 isoform X2 [Malania oleifera]
MRYFSLLVGWMERVVSLNCTAKSMDSSGVSPIEDTIQALLDYLVDPMLPAKSSARDDPSLPQQQLVAKQVHAVVLLYNYYQRNQHPQLEFLEFEQFCKLAVVLKPTLIAHMKLMQRSNDSELDDVGNQLSLTEKTIMDACDICLTLDASKDVPNTEGWPVSKVSVFLIDSKKENCLLLFSSITQGVWSVIEKDLDAFNHNSDGLMEPKHVNRKKRIIKKPLRDESIVDEAVLQQLSFSAVKEATGIDQTDLLVLESHIVYSLSKEKTTTRFYIMQCTESINEEVIQIPIKDVIDSLQGPLVKQSSCGWTVTPVVEYFNVLPYAGILVDCFSSEVLSNGSKISRMGFENVNVNGSQRTGKSSDAEINKSTDESHSNGSTVADTMISGTSTQSPKQKDNNGCGILCFPTAFCGADGMDEDDSVSACEANAVKTNNIHIALQVDYHKEQSAVPINRDLNDTASYFISEMTVLGCQPNAGKSSNIPNTVRVNDCKEQTAPFAESDLNTSASGVNVELNAGRSSNIPNTALANDHKEQTAFSMQSNSGTGVNVKLNAGRSINIPNHVQVDNCKEQSSVGSDLNASASINVKIAGKSSNIPNTVLVDVPKQQTAPPMESDRNASASGASFEVEMVDSVMPCVPDNGGERLGAGNKVSRAALADQDEKQIGNCITSGSKIRSVDKLQNNMAAKNNILTQTALRVLLRKRDKLCHQQRIIEDEIAQCDKTIQTIIDGCEDDLALKIESIIEGCNDVCLRSAPQMQDRTYQLLECPPLYLKRKRLSEAVLALQSPCQELDGICYENNWILPTYRVSSRDGGFQAEITVKGMDFECSSGGDLRANPREARESAAAQMLAKLPSMANPTS